MKKIASVIIRNILIAVVIFSAVGAGSSFFTSWSLIEGVYIVNIGVGCVFMLFAGIKFIGTPKDRFQFFAEKDSTTFKRIEKIPFEYGGVQAAVIGTVLIILGFFIEALLH